jgi:hypothetical protein
MNGIPNTTISILRGESEDAFGDSTDTATLAASGVLASIHEVRQFTSTRADLRLQQVGEMTLRIKYGTDIRIMDRVKDERSGLVYVINDVTQAPSWARKVDVRCRLRRVAGT